MLQTEDEILVQAHGAVAAANGGSARLNEFIASRLKTDAHEIDLVIPLPFEGAVKHVASVLEQAGQRIEPPHAESTHTDRDEGQRMVRILTDGGPKYKNPVVVTALVTEGRAANSVVRLRAAAKEGLIRQRPGEHTAMRFASWLTM
ncbi:hypothetical protein CDO52_08640 [Nocardiopsis gilva YIM 90087]|uniref:Uncharacterized protein n=1 Tax=Nocardiopsis gilva YIM 90087 TaxID=1235441 RepID=A0A223S3Y4_9ACTN|nr:hypothetical protein [Nocardiopsis gilva]ASU82840.1 hypothetical protein CDO52_08640 [Nocardiopsis gilva YIM 90087]